MSNPNVEANRKVAWLAIGYGFILWIAAAGWYDIFGRGDMGGGIVDLGNKFLNPVVNVAARAVTGLWDVTPPNPEFASNFNPRKRFNLSLSLLSGPLLLLPASIVMLFCRRLGAWMIIVGGVVYSTVAKVGHLMSDRGYILPFVVTLPMIVFGVWALRRPATAPEESETGWFGVGVLFAFLAAFVVGVFAANISYMGAAGRGWLGQGIQPTPLGVIYAREKLWFRGTIALGVGGLVASFLSRRWLGILAFAVAGASVGFIAFGLWGELK